MLFFRASAVNPVGWTGVTLQFSLRRYLCCFLIFNCASMTNRSVCVLCWFSMEMETALKAVSRGQEAWCGKRGCPLPLNASHTSNVIVVIIDCLINQHLLPVNHISCSEAKRRVQLPHSNGEMSSLFASKPFVFYKRAGMPSLAFQVFPLLSKLLHFLLLTFSLC